MLKVETLAAHHPQLEMPLPAPAVRVVLSLGLNPRWLGQEEGVLQLLGL